MRSTNWHVFASHTGTLVRGTKTRYLSRWLLPGSSIGFKTIAMITVVLIMALSVAANLSPAAVNGQPFGLGSEPLQRLVDNGRQGLAPSGGGRLFSPPGQASPTETNGVVVTDPPEQATATTEATASPTATETTTATATATVESSGDETAPPEAGEAAPETTTGEGAGEAPSGSVEGSAYLEGLIATFPEGAVAQSVSVQLDGSISGTLNAIDGIYRFDQLPPGIYTITISAPGFISQIIEVSLGVGETAFAPTVTLLAGDINQDGRVSLADLSIAAALLPETAVPPAPATADYTGDGLVTQADFDVVASNFGS